MDEFTDGQEVSEELNITQDANSEQVPADGQAEQDPSSLPLPTDAPETADAVMEEQENPDTSSNLEEIEPDAEVAQEPETSPTPVLDYEELLEELQTQTKELKAIRDVTDQQTEFNQNMLNIGIVSIAGLGLVCGFVAALIFSNYMRH